MPGSFISFGSINDIMARELSKVTKYEIRGFHNVEDSSYLVQCVSGV